MIDARRQGIFERAEFYLVIVARIQQCQFTPFIQPLFQFGRRDLGRCALGRFDTGDAEGDDLALNPHQHAPEGLGGCVAIFDCQWFESGDRTQATQEGLDGRFFARNKEINSLCAQQDCAAQAMSTAESQELGAQGLQVLQRGEPIGCDVNDGQRVGFLFVCHAAFYTESPSWVNEGQEDETGLRGAWLGSP